MKFKRPTVSIQRRLLVWLLAVLLAGALATGAIVYQEARDEANALFDYQLRQIAQSLPARAFGPLTAPRAGLPQAEDGVVVQIWSLDGERLYLSHPDSHLPAQAELGFSSEVTSEGDWRTYAALFQDVVIQVAQPMRVRRELAAAVALRTVMPLLLLLPVLGVLIWFTVGRGLMPVRRIARDVGLRDARALDPLPEAGLPDEVRPLVEALNRLLGRLGRSLATQRDFIADAAHELRTPLTALQLQVQLAQRAQTLEESHAALAPLKDGLMRASHLVEQLLALARAGADVAPIAFEMLDLTEIARTVIVDNTSLALDRNIDLGLTNAGPVFVLGSPDSLRVLVENLIDNALNYSLEGGAVDVRVDMRQGEARLVVADNGPGIDPTERERVFDRFYRGSAATRPGSGLGLAIVRNIAQQHGATVELLPRENGSGLVALVRFTPSISGASSP